MSNGPPHPRSARGLEPLYILLFAPAHPYYFHLFRIPLHEYVNYLSALSGVISISAIHIFMLAFSLQRQPIVQRRFSLITNTTKNFCRVDSLLCWRTIPGSGSLLLNISNELYKRSVRGVEPRIS